MYLYLGQAGSLNGTLATFNGGGRCNRGGANLLAGSGGGASDVRIGGIGTNHRVVVAGGGMFASAFASVSSACVLYQLLTMALMLQIRVVSRTYANDFKLLSCLFDSFVLLLSGGGQGVSMLGSTPIFGGGGGNILAGSGGTSNIYLGGTGGQNYSAGIGSTLWDPAGGSSGSFGYGGQGGTFGGGGGGGW
jgi:hypothetical protein